MARPFPGQYYEIVNFINHPLHISLHKVNIELAILLKLCLVTIQSNPMQCSVVQYYILHYKYKQHNTNSTTQHNTTQQHITAVHSTANKIELNVTAQDFKRQRPQIQFQLYQYPTLHYYQRDIKNEKIYNPIHEAALSLHQP